MMNRVRSLLAGVFILVLAAPGYASASQPAPTAAPIKQRAASSAAGASALPASATIRFGQNGVSALNWANLVAAEKSFFQQEALTVDTTIFSDPSHGIQAIVTGSLDLGVVAPDSAIRAVKRGGDLKILAGTVGSPPWSLIVRPEIKSFADLKGKKLGSSALKGNITAVQKRILEANGLKSGDYDLIVVGGTSARYAALQSGGIAGALLAQPQDLRAVATGFPRLAFGADVVKDYQTEVIYGRGSWAREHRNVVERFLRALVKASDWLYNPANKDESVKILAKNTKSTDELALQTYNLYFVSHKVLPRRLELNMDGLTTAIQFMADDGDLTAPLPKAAEFVDASFLEKASQ